MHAEERPDSPIFDRVDGELSEDQLDTIAGGLGQRVILPDLDPGHEEALEAGAMERIRRGLEE